MVSPTHFWPCGASLRPTIIRFSPKGRICMGSSSSSEAIRNINDFGMSVRNAPSTTHRKPADEFGSLTFNEEVQRARLPKDVFRALRRSIAHGESLDPSVADIVASTLKDRAVEHA